MYASRSSSRAAPQELTNSFCRTAPAIAPHFARVTFRSDNHGDVPRVQTPLLLQCSQDVISTLEVVPSLHRLLPRSTLHMLQATGHRPHLGLPP